jgi:hypothetical protein
MKKLTSVLIIAAAMLVSAMPLMAQQKKVNSTGGNSPHETTSAVVDGARVTITYGRPYTKDPKTGAMRKIWGGLVPYDEAWRLGADEATTLIAQKPINLGGAELPAGAYTLYFVPSESGDSKLAISKQVGAWGVPVDQKHDFARVNLKKESTDKQVDQLTITVGKNPAGGGLIKIIWENQQFSVPFTVTK